jgi:DNA-binding GntR family transcriptional regulator
MARKTTAAKAETRRQAGSVARLRPSEPAAGGPKHDQVYRILRDTLISGRIVPGRGVTLRGLAESLDVSPMPVREAIRRLAAEGGLVVGANRRVYVPPMTAGRFDELVRARTLLEPELAGRALHAIDSGRLDRIRMADDDIEAALANGDVEGYMAANRRFHFEIYTAAPSSVLLPMVESLWIQFGPFMRAVYGRVGTAILVDQHVRAVAAVEAGDETELREAIRADILDGMSIIGASALTSGTEAGRADLDPAELTPGPSAAKM